MTEANKADVKWCLTTTSSEKKIRFAAQSLFTKINSVHKEALSTDEYIKAINELTAGHEKERKLLIAAGKILLLRTFKTHQIIKLSLYKCTNSRCK